MTVEIRELVPTQEKSLAQEAVSVVPKSVPTEIFPGQQEIQTQTFKKTPLMSEVERVIEEDLGEFLDRNYSTKRLSQRDISRVIINISEGHIQIRDGTISDWLKIFNVLARSRPEGSKLAWQNPEKRKRKIEGRRRALLRPMRETLVEDPTERLKEMRSRLFKTEFGEELELNKPMPKKTKENIVFSSDHVESRSHQKNQELLRNLKNAKTAEEKQIFLNLVPRGLYHKLVKGADPLIVPVKALVTEAGFHIGSLKNFARFRKVLIDSDIPMGEIHSEDKSKGRTLTYYFILSQDEERAKQELLKNRYLKQFLTHPVSQVAGPEQQGVPSVTLIEQRDRFRRLGALLLEFGVALGRPTKKYRTLLLEKDDFPVPIFFYPHRGYYYPVEKDAQLRNHTEQFLENLRTTS